MDLFMIHRSFTVNEIIGDFIDMIKNLETWSMKEPFVDFCFADDEISPKASRKILNFIVIMKVNVGRKVFNFMNSTCCQCAMCP